LDLRAYFRTRFVCIEYMLGLKTALAQPVDRRRQGDKKLGAMLRRYQWYYPTGLTRSEQGYALLIDTRVALDCINGVPDFVSAIVH
jgi:hypothetical protein